MLGKVAGAVFLIFLLLGAFRDPILDGIKDWRTDGGTTTQSELATTAAGITSANVTLDKDLYQALTSQVTEISSTDGTDTPVATAYDEDTLQLTIGGLDDDATRTLTIIYYGETDNDAMRIIGPWLAFFLIGSLTVLIIWSVFEGKKRRRSY